VNRLAPQELRTYFITAVTANRRRLFQVESNAQLLLDLLNEDRAKRRYQVHAFVFMPDHVHLLMTPAPDVSVEKAVQFIKGGFSFRLKSKLPVWEDSFKKLGMKDPASYDHHRVYIHQNPMRAGLCERAEEFRWSSANGAFVLDAAPGHLRA
jgi:putative transposase